MTQYVIDTSVAAKWFIPEDHSVAARKLLAPEHGRVVPDLIFVEFANALVKRRRRNEILALDAVEHLSALEGLVQVRDSARLMASAVEIAVTFDRSAYDATFVALAVFERCQLVTADRRLYNALEPHLPKTMLWIEDVPAPAG